jgi:hypothetical protein
MRAFCLLLLFTPFIALAGGVSGGTGFKEIHSAMNFDTSVQVTPELMDDLEKIDSLKEFRSLSTTVDPKNGLRIKLFRSEVTGQLKIVEEKLD